MFTRIIGTVERRRLETFINHSLQLHKGRTIMTNVTYQLTASSTIDALKATAQSELKLKKGICVWVKWVVSIYLIFIAYILLLLVLNEGKLESSVVIALLTTTTINILGLPYMIIKSLFPAKKD